MSRLSKVLRRVRFGPVVDRFVKMAEELLGSGTGAIKKKLVEDWSAALVKRLKEADLPVPDNYEGIVDELLEQAVDKLKERVLEGATVETVVAVPTAGTDAKPALAVAAAEAPRRRGGRKPGSKNKPKAGVGTPPSMLDVEEAEVVELDEFDEREEV